MAELSGHTRVLLQLKAGSAKDDDEDRRKERKLKGSGNWKADIMMKVQGKKRSKEKVITRNLASAAEVPASTEDTKIPSP